MKIVLQRLGDAYAISSFHNHFLRRPLTDVLETFPHDVAMPISLKRSISFNKKL